MYAENVTQQDGESVRCEFYQSMHITASAMSASDVKALYIVPPFTLIATAWWRQRFQFQPRLFVSEKLRMDLT